MEYGLIGEHLGHSFSKEIHARIGDYKYELKEIPKDEVDSFMKRKDFKGINVTIPYKQTVIPYLDFISDGAKKIGAVNCIVNKCGKLYGYNTDFDGMRALILKNKIDLSGKKVLILGTGGTSKTAHAVCESLGAKTILIVSRSNSQGVITYDEALSSHLDADAIINTTPSGMFPNTDASPIDLACFTKLVGVIDAIFNPLRSNLVMQAKGTQIPSEGGLYMLVMQAIVASEYFFETKYDAKLCDSIYADLLGLKENIVLIGMPASGKSTVGKRISNIAKKDFFDSDPLIEERAGKTIPEIFAEDGEKVFRQIESEVIKDLSDKSGIIISTGGGAILKPENVKNLKKNGKIVLIDRPLEELMPTSDRPLANSKDKIVNLYNERLPIYKSVADIIIDVKGNVEWTAKKVLKEVKNENKSY